MTDNVLQPHQRVLVGDIQPISNQGEPVRCIEVLCVDPPSFVGAVSIGIAQQGQLVAAFDGRGALGLEEAGDVVLGSDRKSVV